MILTGSVQVFGRLRRALQPRRVEVAPFVLGFVARTGAAGWRRRRGRNGRNRSVRRTPALTFIESEEPRHDPPTDTVSHTDDEPAGITDHTLPLHECHAALCACALLLTRGRTALIG